MPFLPPNQQRQSTEENGRKTVVVVVVVVVQHDFDVANVQESLVRLVQPDPVVSKVTTASVDSLDRPDPMDYQAL